MSENQESSKPSRFKFFKIGGFNLIGIGGINLIGIGGVTVISIACFSVFDFRVHEVINFVRDKAISISSSVWSVLRLLPENNYSIAHFSVLTQLLIGTLIAGFALLSYYCFHKCLKRIVREEKRQKRIKQIIGGILMTCFGCCVIIFWYFKNPMPYGANDPALNLFENTFVFLFGVWMAFVGIGIAGIDFAE